MPTNLEPGNRQFDPRTGRWREPDILDGHERLMAPWVAFAPIAMWFAVVGAMFLAGANIDRVGAPPPPPAASSGPG